MSRGIQVRSLGFVSTGGRLLRTQDESSLDEPSLDDLERSESFTSSADTAFSTFVKKEDDSGTIPIPHFQFDPDYQQVKVKREDEYGEEVIMQFADYGEQEEPEEHSETECECYECIKNEVVPIKKEEYEDSLQKRKQKDAAKSRDPQFSDFIEQLYHRGGIFALSTHHRQRPSGPKKVYECTFNDCKLTFSSLITIYYHIRFRHLNLEVTLKKQKEQNKLETRLPENCRPATYVIPRINSWDGILSEYLEFKFEELFKLSNTKLSYLEREHIVFTLRICESILITWFQRRRDRERYIEKTRGIEPFSESSTQERSQLSEGQISPHLATATDPPCLPPSTSSNLNESAQFKRPITQINFFKRLLAYNEGRAKEDVQSKLKYGKCIVLNLTTPDCFLSAFGIELRSNYTLPESATVASDRPQSSISLNNQRESIDVDRSFAQSANSSDSDSGSNKIYKSKKKNVFNKNNDQYLRIAKRNHAAKVQKEKSVSKPNCPPKISATLKLNVRDFKNKIQKEIAKEKYKINKSTVLNKSNQRVGIKPHTSSHSTSARERVLPSPSQKMQAARRTKEKEHSRQSSITGPLHCSQKQQQWRNSYKIPKLSQSGRQSTEDSTFAVSQ